MNPPRRIGRPPAEQSRDRRAVIVAAARRHFATAGFDATSLSAVADDVGITVPAMYRYAKDKTALYELVFRETLQAAWTARLARLDHMPTFAAQLGELARVIVTHDDVPDSREFLAAAPIELRRHRDLRHLVAERERIQNEGLRAMLQPLHDSRQLQRFESLDDAVQAARLLIVGWGLESYCDPRHADQFTATLINVAAALEHGVGATAAGHPQLAGTTRRRPATGRKSARKFRPKHS